MSFLSHSTQFVRACASKQAIGRFVPSNARAASGQPNRNFFNIKYELKNI